MRSERNVRLNKIMVTYLDGAVVVRGVGRRDKEPLHHSKTKCIQYIGT